MIHIFGTRPDELHTMHTWYSLIVTARNMCHRYMLSKSIAVITFTLHKHRQTPSTMQAADSLATGPCWRVLGRCSAAFQFFRHDRCRKYGSRCQTSRKVGYFIAKVQL
jgi:hypothetical protein